MMYDAIRKLVLQNSGLGQDLSKKSMTNFLPDGVTYTNEWLEQVADMPARILVMGKFKSLSKSDIKILAASTATELRVLQIPFLSAAESSLLQTSHPAIKDLLSRSSSGVTDNLFETVIRIPATGAWWQWLILISKTGWSSLWWDLPFLRLFQLILSSVTPTVCAS